MKVRSALGHSLLNKVFFNYTYIAFSYDEFKEELKARQDFWRDFKRLLMKEGIGLLIISEKCIYEIIKASFNEPFHKLSVKLRRGKLVIECNEYDF